MADRSVVYRLRAELGQFRAQMAQASASTKKLAGDLTSIDKEGVKARKGLDTLGGAAGKVGLVAAAGLGAAVIKAADFDSSMSKVQAATHETAANMDQLRQAALDAGAETAFSATEAAAGIENLAKAGVETTEILNGGLMGALDLAAAGEMEVAEAAEAAAGAMAQFKLDGEDVPHIADLLAAGAGKAQGEVSDMVMALKQGGTVAAQTGLTLEETTGALAAMAEQSLLGSDAGTSFKTMLASLTPNSEKAAAAMEQYNISAFDAQGNFVGMVELADQLRNGLGHLTDEQRASTLETIFGSDAVRAASIIYDNGAEGIQKWITNVDDAGYASETAAIKLDNLKGDLEELGGSLETALIGTGEGAQGPLRSLVQQLTDVVNAYNELPQGAQTAAAGVLAAGAVVGGSIWVGSKLIQGIANTRQAMQDLGVTGGRTGRALSAIGKTGAVVAGLFAVDAALSALNNTMEDAAPRGEELQTRLLDLSDGRVADLGKDFGDLGKNLDKFGTGTLSSVLEAADALPAVGEGLALVNNALPGESNQEAFREFKDQIDAIDASLSGLVSSGGPDKAQAAFDALAVSLNLTSHGQEELLAGLPQFRDALAGAANDARLAGEATGGAAGETSVLSTQTERLSRKAERMGAVAEKQATALAEVRAAARETGGEFFGLGEKVDKAKVSLGGWLRDLEKQAEALRNFTQNAKTAAKRGLSEGLIKELQEAGPAGALRMKQLADATDKEIARANRAWRRGQAAIDEYVDAVDGVPKEAKTDLKINYQDALIGIDAVRERLALIKDKSVTIRVTASGTAALTQGFGPQGGFADGGWTGPGGKHEPKGVVHGNEYVFSAEATDGNVAMLERLHRELKGYADGGFVGYSPMPAAAAPRVRLDGLKVTGTLNTPWGPAQIEGIARDAARREVDDAAAYSGTLSRQGVR